MPSIFTVSEKNPQTTHETFVDRNSSPITTEFLWIFHAGCCNPDLGLSMGHHFLRWVCLKETHPWGNPTGLRWTGQWPACYDGAAAMTTASEKDIKLSLIKSDPIVMLKSALLHPGCCRLDCISTIIENITFQPCLVLLSWEQKISTHSSKCWSVDSFFRWDVVKPLWVCCCCILFVQEWWAEFCFLLPVCPL